MNESVTEPRPGTEGPPFRVLIADDDEDMVVFLGRLLRTHGFEVLSASDGTKALEQIAKSPPDLVLLDVMMPGISGFEVCERLKSSDSTALIPIILVTALDDHESRIRGIKSGADDFLSKPVNREELIARVNTLRRLHETRRELESRRLAAEIQSRETMRKAFLRYISPRLADRIISVLGDEGRGIFGNAAERTRVVALFADLRGFTRLTELTEVSEVIGILNEYFTILTDAAYQHDGTIFNMAGDSMFVGFNVPFEQDDAPARAWRTAKEMVTRFAPVASRWKERHGVLTGVGIGICEGEAIIGNVGSAHYMNYTVIGNPVNTAARLMQMAAPNEVLVSGAYFESIRNLVSATAVEERGEVTLRGKADPIRVLSLRVTGAAA